MDDNRGWIVQEVHGEQLPSLHCQWQGCHELFPDAVKLEAHVLGLHRNELLNASVGGKIVCGIVGCGAEFALTDFFHRHLSFHVYQAKLMLEGALVLRQSQEERADGVCKRNTDGCNKTSYLGEPLRCYWDGCQFVYDDILTYFAHVNGHIRALEKSECPRNGTKCLWAHCNAVLGCRKSLVNHVLHHTGEKRIACPTCGGFFASKLKLVDHIVRQGSLPANEQSYQCRLCHKIFPNERILRVHVRHHVSQYKCPYCEMTTETPSSLRRHIRFRHTTQGDFACEVCSKRFKDAFDLNAHVRNKHLKQKGTKEFHCDKCEKKFSYKTALMRHKKTHDLHAQPYACHLCTAAFTCGAQCSKHLHAAHALKKPDGHCRFIYRKNPDGFYRLSTERFERAELFQVTTHQTTFLVPTADTNAYVHTPVHVQRESPIINSDDACLAVLQPAAIPPVLDYGLDDVDVEFM